VIIFIVDVVGVSTNPLARVPGPSGGHIIFGHTLKIIKNPIGYSRAWMAKYGHVVRFKGMWAVGSFLSLHYTSA
jgi:hypothetical protein